MKKIIISVLVYVFIFICSSFVKAANPPNKYLYKSFKELLNASSTLSISPCTNSSCIPFNNTDYLQIYNRLLNNVGMASSVVPCTGTTCIAFNNTDLLQIYRAIIVTSVVPTVTTQAWSIIGNAVSTNTNFIGTTTSRSLRIKTNGTDVAKFDSVGIFRLLPTSSTLNIGAAQWNDPTDGLTVFSASTGATFGRTHTNGTIKGFDLPFGNGSAFSDGYWIGTSTVNDVGIIANANVGVPSLVVVGNGHGQQGAVMINPSPTAGFYAPVAELEVFRKSNTEIFRCLTGTATPVFEVNHLNNRFSFNTRIGSQVVPSATLDITGTFSISGTSTLTGTQNNGTLVVTGTSSLTNVLNTGTINSTGAITTPTVFSGFIAAGSAPNATLNIRSGTGLNRGQLLFGRNVSGALLQYDEITARLGIALTGTPTARLHLGNNGGTTAVPQISFEVQTDPASTSTGDIWRNSTGLNVVGPLITGSLSVTSATLSNLAITNTLGVSGTTSLTGLTNTGTLSASGSSTLTGINNTGTLVSTGNATITGTAKITSSVVAQTFSTGASSGAAGSAPLYISSGTLLTVPEINAVSNDGQLLYFTNNTTTRQNIDIVQFSATTNSFNATTTTLANVTNLTASMTTGHTYKFDVVLFVDADAVGGSKFSMAGNGSASSIIFETIMVDNTSNANTITARKTAMGDSGAAGQSGTTSGFVKISGLIICNGTGTLRPAFAQNAANGTSTVVAGSYMFVSQIN